MYDKCGQIRTLVRICPHFHTFLCKFFSFWSPCAPKHVMWQRVFLGVSEFKVRWTDYFASYVRWLFGGVTYLRYTALTSPKKGETAVCCCDPALSVLVMLVSRNFFHIVSALQSIVCLNAFIGWSDLIDPTLAEFIVCGPLQFLV